MTSLVDGARRLLGQGSDLDTRVGGLHGAADAARGRLDDALLDRVQVVADRAGERLRLSAEHTVVAIAGATGSGKSTTFNRLIGLDLAAVGVRRPTTSWATACVWGPGDATELLTWLGIPPRHQVRRDSLLDTGREDLSLNGAVLLDLPDHDSTVVSHHLEVDRLVELADLLIWVLDPQKYADAAVHRRYLAPLAGHAEVILVVLNQLDTVPPEGREPMLADVRRLLAADGLPTVPLLGLSARQGQGVAQLRDQIAERVAAKRAARQRIEADVRRAADLLSDASGRAPAPALSRARVGELEEALAAAAGVPTVVAAVAAATRMRANRATGWPLVAWLGRLRPDPLRRLHLDLGPDARALTGSPRTSVPAASPVQRALVDSAVRAVADDVSGGLNRPWAAAVRRASLSHAGDLVDRLDAAVSGVDLGAARVPGWARFVRLLQWLLIGTAVAGGVWLMLLAVLGYLRLPEPETPYVAGLPVPTLLLIGGVAVGVLLALLCRLLVRWTARRRARAAERRLRHAVDAVCAELVVSPIQAELSAYAQVADGLATATR